MSSINNIITANIFGGLQPYTYAVTDFFGATAGSPSNGTVSSSPLVIGGLGINSQLGYTVTITDSNNDTCVTTGLTVNGQDMLTVIATPTDTTCYNSNNGAISLNVFGGTPPYFKNTTGAGNYSSSSLNMTSLYNGTYTTTVVDGNGASVSATTVVNSTSPQLIIASPGAALNKQCSPTTYNIPFFITAGLSAGATAYVSYKIDNNAWFDIPNTFTFINSTTPLVFQIPVSSMQTSISIKFSDTITRDCYSNTIGINKANITLPTQTLSANILRILTGNSTTPYVHRIITTGGIGAVTTSYMATFPESVVISPISSGSLIEIYTTQQHASITVTITDSVGCQITVAD